MSQSSPPDAALAVAQHQSALRRFVRSRVAVEADAEDILQEVWYQFSRLTEPLQQPQAWLFRVARNKLIDHYRKVSPDWLEDYLWEEGGNLLPEMLLSEDEPGLEFLRAQFWEELYEALDSLPEAQREVFLLHELEGLTLREIAERQGANLKTVISRKGYALRQLRVALADLFEELVADLPPPEVD
jgi:RNA polymerase sigma factor (sigma-70 family)